jgi:hypothetical protein
VPSRWSPDERLAHVERLQARSGAASESLFDAHDLGSAYRSAGENSSKRARINAALHAAKQRGDLDEVLDAVAQFLGDGQSQPQPAPAPQDITQGVLAVPTDKPIFLSHAFADKALADLLRSTLVLGGVPEDRIFYSSDRSTGIPSGEDVGAYLRRSLQGAGLVIELVSETFLTRPMCLMELGGAWALGTSTYPIVVPPLTRDEATKQIGNVQMGVLGTDAEIGGIFDELHDRLSQDLGIQTKVTTWNREIANFRQQLPSKLAAVQAAAAAAPVPPQVAAVAAAPTASGDKITIANISVIAGSLGSELHAEATNSDTVEHSATIKATFYDANGRIVGTADGLVNQLRAGGTKTVSMQSIPDHDRAKVEVDTIF